MKPQTQEEFEYSQMQSNPFDTITFAVGTHPSGKSFRTLETLRNGIRVNCRRVLLIDVEKAQAEELCTFGCDTKNSKKLLI
jgi:hypothetical protein